MTKRADVINLSAAVIARARRELEAFCEARIPQRVRDKVRLETSVRGRALTLWEARVPRSGSQRREWTRMKVAQFRFDPAARLWTLHYRDRRER
jgi:hypothetical protein